MFRPRRIDSNSSATSMSSMGDRRGHGGANLADKREKIWLDKP